jgi:hypothetical protein
MSAPMDPTEMPHPAAPAGKPAVDLPHLLFVTAIAAWCGWYAFDAWRAQRTVANLILIVPVAVLALLMYLGIAVGCLRRRAHGRKPIEGGVGVKILVSMLLLGAFVLAGPLLGFDIACFGYVLLMMYFLGERRPRTLLAVPLLFAAIAVYCFTQLLYVPLPLAFFGGGA